MDLTVLQKWPRLDKRLTLCGMLIAIVITLLKAATAARLKCSHEEPRAIEVPQILAIQARVILGDDVDNAVYPFIVRIEVTFGGRNTSTENEVGSNFIDDTLQDACPDIQPSGNKRNPRDPNTPGRMCVGSVISPKHVLTAGRCLWPLKTSPVYTVYYGSQRQKDQKPTAVVRVTRHPECRLLGREDRALHDLAVLEVAQRFPNDVFPVKIPKTSPGNMTGRLVKSAGWGNTVEEAPEEKKMNHSEVLQQAILRILSPAACMAKYPRADLQGQICARTRTGQPHLDDFGAPLVHTDEDDYLILGVFSWFDISTFPMSPFVFTSTLDHQEWIRSVIGKGAEHQ